MKTLELKSFTVATGQDVKYADLIKTCVNSTGERGINATEMKARLRILDALEVATDKLELEDADVQTLKPLVEAMPWAIVHTGLVGFCDDVKAL
jgi:hypothetical protein